MLDHQIHFILGNAEVRGEPQRIGTAVDHADTVFAHVFLDAVIAIALEDGCQLTGEQQAGTLDLGDQLRQLALQGFQLGDELLAAGDDIGTNLGVRVSITAHATSMARGLVVMVLP